MGINQKRCQAFCSVPFSPIPCWLLGQQFHLVGSPIFAIILGIIIGTIFTSWKREKSRCWYWIYIQKKILQWAVILLGFGLNITQILHVGWISLPVIISTIATSLIVTYVIYRLTHIDSNTAVLIGVGSSICGGSAIAAAAPVIKAEDRRYRTSDFCCILLQCSSRLCIPSIWRCYRSFQHGFWLIRRYCCKRYILCNCNCCCMG